MWVSIECVIWVEYMPVCGCVWWPGASLMIGFINLFRNLEEPTCRTL